MRSDYRKRWTDEARKYGDRLKKPKDLLSRSMSSEDFIDSAIIGGYPLADVIAGKVHEAQIPTEIKTAFHAQYPEIHKSFVDEVRELHGNPEQLQGLINGVKGKVFEEHYVHYLNQTLPTGLHADLAQHANNPGWDISITDSHGHVQDMLQLKATDNLSYIKHALELHPNIDVVVPHDSFAHFSGLHDFANHIIDAHGDTLTHLTDTTTSAVDHAASAVDLLDHPAFHLPGIAILFACGQNYYRYRTGKISSAKAIAGAFERSSVAVVASGAAWVASALTGKTVVGIPVAIWVRSLYGKWKKRQVFALQLEAHLFDVRESHRALEKAPQQWLLA